MSVGVAPWTLPDVDPELASALLARRFPRAVVWRGEYTGSWWAVVRRWDGTDELLEAGSADELGRLLEDFFWRHDPPRVVVGPDGAWTRTGVVRGHVRVVRRAGRPGEGAPAGAAVRAAPPTAPAPRAAAPPEVGGGRRWFGWFRTRSPAGSGRRGRGRSGV